MRIIGEIRNKGRFDTTLMQVTLEWALPLQGPSGGHLTWGAPRPISVMVPDANLKNAKLSGPLRAQYSQGFAIIDLAQIDPGLVAALHDHRRVTIGIGTGAGKLTRQLVKYA